MAKHLFGKGNNFGKGRPKGSLSKKGINELVEEKLGRNIIDEMLTLAGSNPKLRLEVLRDLLPYCYPKLQATTLDGDVSANLENETVDQLAAWLMSCVEITQ